MEIMTRALVMDEMVGLRDVELTAHQGLDPGLIGLGVELQGTVHGPVIRDCHGVHAVGLGFIYQISETDGPVKHGILGMDVEMDKGDGHKILRNFFIEI